MHRRADALANSSMGRGGKDACSGQHRIESNGSLRPPAAAFDAVGAPTGFAAALKVGACAAAGALREVGAGAAKVSNFSGASGAAGFPPAARASASEGGQAGGRPSASWRAAF